LLINAMLVCSSCQELSQKKLQPNKHCEKEAFENFQVLKVQLSEENLKWKFFKDLQNG